MKRDANPDTVKIGKIARFAWEYNAKNHMQRHRVKKRPVCFLSACEWAGMNVRPHVTYDFRFSTNKVWKPKNDILKNGGKMRSDAMCEKITSHIPEHAALTNRRDRITARHPSI